MNEPIVEIVYSLTEEDLLHQVGNTMKTSSKDPLLKAKLGFISSHVLAGAAVIFCVWLTVTRPEARRALTPIYLLPGIFAMNGYRVHKGYRDFYSKVRTNAQRTTTLVLRANRGGFSITRPGVSESSINWTAVRDVHFTPDYLSIITVEDGAYRVPSRYVSKDQWEVLRGMLSDARP